ncbi:LysR family transcriptional regulator [Tahibacter aquaticus]|uniref:LysR family transcriptional regulator n=1 Tax=Tahibacter aquaticus TaxID=520092 RepID=A0A4R6Z7B5_9GAMM|nr:LysR family transcriptional regulator [Tahibacter aquaticus]TDR47655.1 LysR family transcriptional regulator [Tahibacter aquaticus]
MSRQFDDLMLGSIELFCLTAEQSSFTAAAARAGLTPAAVSRAISRLEQRLGVRLFSRTTRQVRLTDDGRAYFLQCRQALNQLAEAERELSGQQQKASGTLRISLPTPLGHYRILPLLPQFRAQHPEVQLDLQLSDRNVDLLAEGYDLAVRGRAQPDSSLVARKLIDAELVVVATPGYFARAGTPLSPDALAGHDCLQFLLPRSGQPVPWLFRRDGVDVEVETSGQIHTREQLLSAVTLVRHGAGLLQTYRFIVEDDLARGSLHEVLQDYGGRSRPFSLLYAGARHMPLRLRVFIDFLLRAFGQAV